MHVFNQANYAPTVFWGRAMLRIWSGTVPCQEAQRRLHLPAPPLGGSTSQTSLILYRSSGSTAANQGKVVGLTEADSSSLPLTVRLPLLFSLTLAALCHCLSAGFAGHPAPQPPTPLPPPAPLMLSTPKGQEFVSVKRTDRR